MKLIINRSKVSQRFTMINNLTLNDKRLSPEAIGLLVYFLSRPPGWDFQIASYCQDRPVCEKKVRRMMRELSEFGYLRTYRQRSDSNPYQWIIEISEVTKVFKMSSADDGPRSTKSSTSQNCQVNKTTSSNCPPRFTTLDLPGNSRVLSTNNDNNTNNKELLNNTDIDIFKNKNISCLANETDHLFSKEKLTKKQKQKRSENKKFNEDAIEILNFLNEKTGKNFRAVETNLKLIVAILKSGATILNCRQVIVKKHREWSTTEMEGYLRPKTLFTKRNFEQYFGELVLPKE